MYSLRWISIRFPIRGPGYIQSSIHEIEPDKLAVVFEYFGPMGPWGTLGDSNSRAWLLDIEAETFKPIACPTEIGESWPKFLGQDTKGNLIIEAETDGRNYVSWNARTGATYSLGRFQCRPELINGRYLACIEYVAIETGAEFVWRDLNEPNHPLHRVPFMEMNGPITPVRGADSFYFMLPTTPQGGLASEVDVVVLMNLTERGPKEVARWPVISGAERTYLPGYLVFQDAEGLCFETHDARTGEIVAKVQQIAPPYFSNFSGNIVHFADFAGIDIAFDLKTGLQLTSNPPTAGSKLSWVDQHRGEYLTWEFKANHATPELMQVRSVSTNEVLHSWNCPDPYVSFSSRFDNQDRPDVTTHFSNDGKSVLFFTQDLRLKVVDKVTGKVLRHIQPRYWTPLIAMGLGLATLIWLICWIRVSVRSGISFWLDELVILTVVMTFLYWRLNLSGNIFDKHRIMWGCVAAMAIATATVVVNQTFFRQVRLLYRLAPIVVLTVAAIFGHWQWIERERPDSILFDIILVSILISSSIVVHLIFFRKAPDVRVETNAARRRLALSEMFGWTGIVAAVLAPLRLYDKDDWIGSLSWNSLARMFLVAGIIATVSLSAYFLTTRRCHVVFRLIAGCLFALFLAVYLKYILSGRMYFASVELDCERILAIVLGSILLALPIRMRS